MNKKLAFKVGTTFAPRLAYTPTAGLAPTTLEDVTITSQIRTVEGELIATLTATKDESDFLAVVLSADAGTDGWPAGACVEWDVRFQHADFGAFYTETVDLQLVRHATDAP